MNGNLNTIDKQLLRDLCHTTKQQNNVKTDRIQLTEDIIPHTFNFPI